MKPGSVQEAKKYETNANGQRITTAQTIGDDAPNFGAIQDKKKIGGIFRKKIRQVE
jgi:hypothetical protein